MMLRLHPIAATLALLYSTPVLAQTPTPRQLRAIRTTEQMVVDGKGDEYVWKKAPKGQNFVERAPNLGAKPPLETSFRVCYDDKNLYLLVQGQLGPKGAQARTLRRDRGDIFTDDTISVKIDPLRDLRTTYAFAANTAGNQFDSLTLEDGRVYFRSWDGVWEVKARSDKQNFTLEYRIPLYILGLKGGGTGVLGFNVSRLDPHRSADYDWQLIPPSRSPVAASTFGTLIDVNVNNRGTVLELVPYALASTNFTRRFSIDPRKQPNLGIGADLRVQTGPGSYIEASVLTDFSQVDTDQVLIANDRFPLYYPERRPFFLNGADVFNFGHASQAQLFFSRRFALDDIASPVLAGAKAYGRMPKLSYGLMNIQTLSVWRDAKRIKQPENFSAARVRYQPIQQVAVGATALGRNRFSSSSGDALSLGLDVDLKSRDNRFRSYSFIAGSWNKPTPKAPTKKGTSLSNRTEFQGLYLRPALTWIWSNAGFTAPLGFYRRSNAAIHEAEVNLVPRPNFWGLRDVELRPRLSITTSPDYKTQLTYAGRFDVAFHWKSNWHAGYFFTGTQDRVLKDFKIFGNQSVGAGRYEHRVHSFWLGTPRQYILSTSTSVDTGSRFGGPYHRVENEVDLRFGRHLLINASYAHVWGKLPNAARPFSIPSVNGQIIVSANTRLSFDTLFRMDLTPTRKQIGNQARLRWRFLPGSDFFFVYANQIPLGRESTQLQTDHRVTLKLNWYHALALGARRRNRSAALTRPPNN